MAKLIVLGSSNAIPDEHHENTYMAILTEERMVLIDCASNPIVRLKQASLDFNLITDLILTHFHPDHVSGVPQLLMGMWLLGRRRKLNIYGLHHTLDRMEDLMGFYEWSNWPDFFPVAFHRLPNRHMITVIENGDLRVFASPVQHLIPTIGLRVDFLQAGKALAYSCDTEPCQAVIDLASGADVLIHEASGAVPGHSSAAQAGEVARQAEVGHLYLIHYPTGDANAAYLVDQARTTYSGDIALANDFMTLEF